MSKNSTKMIPLVLALLMLIATLPGTSLAQCSPLTCTPLNETFGSIATGSCPGSQGDAAATGTAAGVVNLDFQVYNPGAPGGDSEPADGEYGIRCDGSEANGQWWGSYSDKTVDAAGQAGLYLLINSGKGGSYGALYRNEFFHKQISNLCVGETYSVSFSAGNVVRDNGSGCAYATMPSFEVYALPGGTAVQPYTSAFSTGVSPLGATGTLGCTTGSFAWNTYSYPFTATSSSFDLVLVNLYTIAGGNDFAIDDIKVTWSSGSGTGCTPSPVELISFTAEKTSQNVILNWSTATEKNNDYFAIERSADGVHFEQIGTVKGNGTTNEIKYYTFEDHSFNSDIVYYRLKQVDFDNEFKYTPIKSVNVDSADPVIITNDLSSSQAELLISFYRKGEATFTIVDMLGRVVYHGARSDEASISINKSMICCGIYIVKVQIGSEVISKKIALN